MIIKSKNSSSKEKSNLLLPFFEGEIDKKLIQKLSGIKQLSDFSGKFKETIVLYHSNGIKKIFLLGLGKSKDAKKSAAAFKSFAFNHHKKFESGLDIDLGHLPENIVLQASLGMKQATYQIGFFKKEDKKISKFYSKNFSVNISHQSKKVKELINEGALTGQAQMNIMKLVDLPAADKTPEYLGKHALAISKKYGISTKVFKIKELKKMGFGALLGVGQGSFNPPVLIQMEYKPKGSKSKNPKLALVGKGVTFDTGGISMKPPFNMHFMKCDMGGAAAVLGAMELIAAMKLPIHVVGIVPATENSVDAKSILPGDVLTSYSGKTIEVIDTDAEGRLILADALAYTVDKFKPENMIDLATLTGSVVRSFGYVCAGMFSNNMDLARTIYDTGQSVDEKVWQLPIWDDYKSDVNSDIADTKNFSGKSMHGAISAAKFLEVFTDEHPAWVHLDIAGVAFGGSEFATMKSATGYGVRLLFELARKMV